METTNTKPARTANNWPDLAILLVILTFITYAPALRCGFIWDDDDHFTANPAMNSVHGLTQIWSSLAASRYYPLTLTTFWVERHLWGLHPLPYHAVNIALQAANAVLLWTLLRRLRVPGAWFAAALWAVHPVCVETVAWATELKNTQSGFFFFLSVLFFLRFETDNKRGSYARALAFGAAAMLSKPSTVVLPVVLLLCAWWERGRWRRGDILRIAPFFGLALGMSAMTVIEQHRWVQRAGAAGWQLAPAERLVVAVECRALRSDRTRCACAGGRVADREQPRPTPRSGWWSGRLPVQQQHRKRSAPRAPRAVRQIAQHRRECPEHWDAAFVEIRADPAAAGPAAARCGRAFCSPHASSPRRARPTAGACASLPGGWRTVRLRCTQRSSLTSQTARPERVRSEGR